MAPAMFHEQGLQCPDGICRAHGVILADELEMADHLVLCHLIDIRAPASRLYDLNDPRSIPWTRSRLS